ncbi:MAG: AraC family transcriptional regulator [Oscillospiraceae bacterium]|nr:AraC family transcriptional regulator [Oscillospiraceae bacterium]
MPYTESMDNDFYKHSYKVAERPLASLSVYNAGMQHCAAGHSWGPGIRDHFLIHLVVEGAGSLTAKGRTHALEPGDLFLIAPGQTVQYRADAERPWVYCWVGFQGVDAPALISQTRFTAERPVLHTADRETPRRLLTAIYDGRGSRPEDAAAMTGRLYLFLSWLLRHATGAPARRQQAGEEHVRRALTYIANNFATPLTIGDIAAHVGVCRSRLYRAFEEQLNTSPAQYLTQFRMRQACALLGATDLSVKAVAYSVGYEDPLHFSRRFKEVIGVSPSEYIEQALDGGIRR